MAKKKKVPRKPAAKRSPQTGKFLSIGYGETGPGLFANHMLAQNHGDEFHLSFFQIQPPIIMGDDDAVKKQMEDLDTILAKPVARIIVDVDRVPSIIEALQSQLAKAQIAKQGE